MPELSRRGFLRASLAAPLSRALAQSSAPLAVTRLTETIHLIAGAGSNVVVVMRPQGLLLVDCGLAERSGDLRKALAELAPGRRVETVVNTHWHLESTGANDVFAKAGAKIIAHENTRLWMGTDINVKWQNRTYQPRAKEALPTQTFYTTGQFTFGEEAVEYGHLGQAHTDGDIYVRFPAANILVTGDVFTVGQYPILDYSTHGWIGGLSDAAKVLLGLAGGQTRVVPGSGPVQTREGLQSLADMTGAMRTRFVEMMRKGMGVKDMLAAAPTKEFDAHWGNPELFIGNAYPGLWGHVREIGGIV